MYMYIYIKIKSFMEHSRISVLREYKQVFIRHAMEQWPSG